MKTIQTRLCIYPKDVQRITGKSESYGRLLLKKIKIHLKKQDHQVITVEEFCQYMGLKKEDVLSFICE
ncbi:MAG TPA: hypothetical protein VG676_07570 [Chitinophagaceae bacterium]|jgi:hypothetical protein|nr:hypothetical protein [Chitinophagaceae bacterium]